MRRCLVSPVSLLVASLLLVSAMPALAQTATPAAAPTARTVPPTPPLRRWIDVQAFTVASRYRRIETSANEVTANHVQYNERLRARFNLDRKKRYTLTAQLLTGPTWTASWITTGIGTGTSNWSDHHIRHLFASAMPVAGVEAQAGSLIIARGESTEITTWDDDGLMVGGRLSVRRPAALHLDEVSVSHGTIASAGTPSAWAHRHDLDATNYTQALVAKKVSARVSASADYTRVQHTETLRAAAAVRLPASAPVSAVRYEQYARVTGTRAAGFAVTAERSVTARVRLRGGYATVDPHYGSLNGDRYFRGRRVFAFADIKLRGVVSATLYGTQALSSPTVIPVKRRMDAVLNVDLLAWLQQKGRL